MNKKRWCVRHRNGWCAALEEGALPEDMADNVDTLCGMVVVLPFGFEEREPTCSECLKIMEREE